MGRSDLRRRLSLVRTGRGLATTPPDERFDDQAFANLIRDILNMSGLRFDRDGLCTSQESAEQLD
jgi:hypothetical protein